MPRNSGGQLIQIPSGKWHSMLRANDTLFCPSGKRYKIFGQMIQIFRANDTKSSGKWYKIFGQMILISSGKRPGGKRALTHLWWHWNKFNYHGFNSRADVRTGADTGFCREGGGHRQEMVKLRIILSSGSYICLDFDRWHRNQLKWGNDILSLHFLSYN